MNAKILQRLVWKDARSIRSLVLATLLSSLGFYLLLVLMTSLTTLGTERLSIAYAIWFLLPMLVAIGAPAVLIGGEEESGSLAWLKTLPASWRSIVASKMLVTVGALTLVWIFSTTLFQIYLTSISDFWVSRIRMYEGMPEPFWPHLLFAIGLSAGLMLCSLTTAYLFRSPITALVAIVPLSLVSSWLVFGTLDLIVPGRHIRSPGSMIGPAASTIALLVAGVLIGLFLLSVVAAWRRMTWPEKTPMVSEADDPDIGAFRPPRQAPASWYAVSTFGERPSPLRALLWLQMRPNRGLLVMLVAFAILGAFLVMPARGSAAGFGFLLCGGSLFLIASMTFYSDSVRNRCVFLSDRGISPGLVWLTRVAPTLAATGIVLIAIVTMVLIDRYVLGASMQTRRWTTHVFSVISIVLASYSLSQLTSQWSRRPALSFFAAPVFVHMAAFALGALFFFYVNALPVLLLSAAILLYASYRLMPVWMSGRRGKAYLTPMLVAVGASVLMPYVVVLTTRWLTTPAEMTQWSQELAERALPKPDGQAEKMAILGNASTHRIEALATGAKVSWQGREERLEKELESTETIGGDTSIKELLQILTGVSELRYATHQSWIRENRALYSKPRVYSDPSNGNRQHQFDAVRILLKWSGETRRQAVVGQADLRSVLEVAEVADLLAARTLNAYLEEIPGETEFETLLGELPSPELVRESRRNSVIRSWRSSEKLNRFAGKYLHPPSQWWLGVERVRSRRFLDELTRLMLDHWVEGNGLSRATLHGELRRFERESYLGYERGISAYHTPTPLTDQLIATTETDRLLVSLRRKQARRNATVVNSSEETLGQSAPAVESEAINEDAE